MSATPPAIPSVAGAAARRVALRAALASGSPLVLPGASDAAGAMLVERAGFSACYATGAGIANAQFGLPDIGLVSQTERLGISDGTCDPTGGSWLSRLEHLCGGK